MSGFSLKEALSRGSLPAQALLADWIMPYADAAAADAPRALLSRIRAAVREAIAAHKLGQNIARLMKRYPSGDSPYN